MDVSTIFNIVPRLLPAFMLGLVSMVGLITLGKAYGDVIMGTIKTMTGVLILFTGVDVLNTVIVAIAQLFSLAYTTEGVAPAGDWVAFLADFGSKLCW
jgi:ascorbate PTS system EIIC component